MNLMPSNLVIPTSMKIIKQTAFLLFLLLFISPAEGNSLDYYFTHISGDNGLSHNNVKSIVQDSWGFMWFGTRNKLNRYDGISIKVFDVVDPVSKRTNNNIGALLEDSEKKLWVGTDKGVFIYDPITEKFRFLALKAAHGVEINDWVSDIRMDRSKNIWIVVPNQGVFLYHADNKKLELFQLGDHKVPSHGNPECMFIEQNGSVWIGTNGAGVYLYNKSRKKFDQYLGDNNGNTLKGLNIYTMCDYGDELIIGVHESKLLKLHKRKNTLSEFKYAQDINYKIIRCLATINEKIWVGTQFGLYIIDEKTNSVRHLHEVLTNPHSLSDNVIEKIYQDKEGGIWMGTNFGGLSYLSNQGMAFEKYTSTLEPGTISSKRISALKEDVNGKIWVGTEDGGLNILNPATGTFYQPQQSANKNNIYNQKIISIMLQPEKAWIGYFKSGIDIYNISGTSRKHYSGQQLGLNEDSPFAICEDRYGKIWIGNGWGVFVCDNQDMKFKRIDAFGLLYVYDIAEDSEGNIWVATMGSGVFRYDQQTRALKHYLNNINDPHSLSSSSVSSISETSDGSIWFSTDRGGICKYNKDKDNFTTYSIAQGLPDDVAYKILEDKKQNLWFGTNKGLVCFNPRTLKIRVFTQNDGLLCNQFNYKSALASRSGKLYFGSFNGLIAFDPQKFNENQYIPPTYITRMSIYNKEPLIGAKNSPLEKSIIHTNKIVLNYNQSNLSFDFVALSFTAPRSNRYAYKMENLDKEWTYTSDNHSVSYSKLPPGHYVFKLRGTNNDGLWNSKETSLVVEILPPWWQSRPAQAIYIALVLYLIYAYLRWNNRKHEKKNLEKQKLFEAEKEKELYSSKVEFFTDIAHEIRTPLTLINAPLESIKELNIDDTELSKNISIMEENTHQLMGLINQLLDFRKIDSNKFNINLKLNNINEIIKDVYSRFEPIATQRNKTIGLKLAPETYEIPVDKEGLVKILNNLLVNAIKYSQKKIDIELSGSDGTYLKIMISNDGDIIPKEEGEKIFDAFYQLDKTRNVNSSTGIGLSLSRSIAKLHNGNLYFDTEITNMNCFVLELPLTQEKQMWISDDNINANEQRTELSGEHPEKPNAPVLLLVEDNTEMLSFIAAKLQKDFIVEKATNGVDAIGLLTKNTVDIIVSDIMMPEMDGFELCAKVKGDIEFSHIPVILLTAKNDIDSKIQGLTLGADAYIEKPFSYSHLLTQINSLLNNRRREREAFMQKPFLPVQQTGMSKADKEFLEKIVGMITENITDPNFGVEKLSELAYMSRSSLHRKITALTDLTPTDFIRVIRLKKSAEMIQEGKYRIGEVCYLVGINSPSYFIKLFQKQFGMTPKEFDKQSRTKE